MDFEHCARLCVFHSGLWLEPLQKSSASHEQSMLWARATARPGAKDIRVAVGPVGHMPWQLPWYSMVPWFPEAWWLRRAGSLARGRREKVTRKQFRIWWHSGTICVHCFHWFAAFNNNEVVLVFQVSVKHMAVDCNGESFCVIFWSVSLRARSDGSTLLLWLCSFWTTLAFTFHTKEIWSKYEVDKIWRRNPNRKKLTGLPIA